MSVDSDRSENKFCTFCQRNDKTVLAKHWCKTCTATICDDCKSIHSVVPILESHKIVSLSDVDNLKNNIEIDEPCLVHKGKYIEVFCQDHDQLCCSICFATKHRTCKTVESIDDVALEIDESSCKVTPACFKDFLKKLDAVQEEYKDVVRFEKLSEINLPKRAYYGLFVDDTKVLLSIKNPPSLQIYDVADSNGRCIHTYPCSTSPFGLCHSGESMNRVFVSFNSHVDHYQIETSDSVIIKKMETIQLKTHMKAISHGSTLIFAGSDSERMICSSDFSIKHISRSPKTGDEPFISASFHSNQHAFIKSDELHVVVVDQDNKDVFTKAPGTRSLLGLAFDIQDNIFICMCTSKLKQIKRGGG